MKHENKKRAISLILAAVMLCTPLFPADVYGYGDPYSGWLQHELDRTFKRPLVNLGKFIEKKYHDGRVAIGLDDPNSYVNNVIDDQKEGLKTQGKSWLSDGLKKGINKCTDKYIYNLFKQDIKNAVKGMQTERNIISASKNAEEFAAASTRYDAYLASLRNIKDNKNALKAGRALPIDFIFAAWGIYDMMENPEIGYDSPFFEFCAGEIKAYSNTIGLIPIIGKPLSLPFMLIDFATSSKTVVHLVNDSGVRIGWLDSATSWWNNFVTKDSILNPIGKLAKWWFSNVGKDAEKAARDTQTKIAVLKVTKIGINSLGPAGGGPYVQMALGGTCTANDISVYKPNIYLYPEEKTQIDVSFDYPDLLTVSDPAYGEGWTVEAEPDGRLYADGGEYGFLFYESRTKKSLYQFEEGYMIPAEDREKTFEGILRGYGLNDKEIADFNAFWCDKLDKEADYAMYPQLTETVDAAMPVTVTPAPDSRLRLWFAFVKDARPERTAVPTAFEKKGYSMTEWGGFIVKTAG